MCRPSWQTLNLAPRLCPGLPLLQGLLCSMAGNTTRKECVGTMKRNSRRILFRGPQIKLVGVLVLIWISLCLFFKALPWLGLLNDDWFHFVTASTHWQDIFTNWTTWQRPLEGFIWVAAQRLFRNYIPGYYILLFSVQLLSAIVLFLLLGKMLRKRWGAALATAVLLLLFPTDQSRFWLSTLAYRFGLLFLLSAWYTAFLSGSKKRSYLWLSLVCSLLALLSNEMYLLLVFVSAFMRYYGDMPHNRLRAGWRESFRLGAPYLLVMVVYLFYRLMAPELFGLVDGKASLWGASVQEMLFKLRRIPAVNFWEAWLYSIRRMKELNWQGIVVVSVVSITSAIGMGLVSRTSKQTAADTTGFGPATIGSQLVYWAKVLLFGLVLVLLGYVPVIYTSYQLYIGDPNSRLNIAASIGASLATVAFFDIIRAILDYVAGYRLPTRTLSAVMFGIVVAMASGQQYVVRQDSTTAWHIQCSIWQQMFAQIPSLESESYVLVAALPYWQGSVRILASYWEVSAALQFLYADSSLNGDVLPADELPVKLEETTASRFRFYGDHFTTSSSETPIPYERLVLLEYASDDRLKLVESAPPWAAKGLSELYTHPGRIRANTVNPSSRQVIQSPFGFP